MQNGRSGPDLSDRAFLTSVEMTSSAQNCVEREKSTRHVLVCPELEEVAVRVASGPLPGQLVVLAGQLAMAV